MECQSMLFVTSYIPYLWGLWNSFSNCFIVFTAAKGCEKKRNIKLRDHNGVYFEILNLIHVGSCEIFTFCDVMHATKHKNVNTLESGQYKLWQYELEIIFNFQQIGLIKSKCYFLIVILFLLRMILKWQLCGLLLPAPMQIPVCQSTLRQEYWAANITWLRKRCRQVGLHPPRRSPQPTWLAHILHLVLCWHVWACISCLSTSNYNS